jgi:homeobox-leucine zipper protein
VPPALLVRFLREHRSQWSDPGVDAYSAASLRTSPYAIPGLRGAGFIGSQAIVPLAETIDHEEVINLSLPAFSSAMNEHSSDLFLKCSPWRLLSLKEMALAMMRWLYLRICCFCKYVFFPH